MMDSPRTHSHRRCDGVLRRDLLRVGSLTALGLGLTDWFRMKAAGAVRPSARPRACILIWLDGGPSHLDTFDLKPDAPAEVRGPFQPIATNVADIQICEYLPRMARTMDKVALIRSMTSNLGEHNFASQYLLTGYQPTPVLSYPSIGSIVTHVRPRQGALPPHIGIDRPNPAATGGYLSPSADPFTITADPSKPDFAVDDLRPYEGLTSMRLDRRRAFLQALDGYAQRTESQPPPDDSAFEQAYRLIVSPQARQAFDLEREPGNVRDRYGRHRLGQSCLLARRLIEAGAQFVTVTDRGWDTHVGMFNSLKEGYTGGTVGLIPKLDTAYSALLEDLHERGMLDGTLIVLMGEFGRTPKLNPAAGRDHWPRAFSVALAGGGVPGGQVIGASDARGEEPRDRPISPADLARTLYVMLGIDPDRELVTPDARPVAINRDGQLIEELIG